MGTFVQSTRRGPSVVVGERGKTVLLDRDMRVIFENLHDTEVVIERSDECLTCIASTPESAEPLRWRFDLGSGSVRSTKAPLPISKASSLERAIAQCRIELNGRL